MGQPRGASVLGSGLGSDGRVTGHSLRSWELRLHVLGSEWGSGVPRKALAQAPGTRKDLNLLNLGHEGNFRDFKSEASGGGCLKRAEPLLDPTSGSHFAESDLILSWELSVDIAFSHGWF